MYIRMTASCSCSCSCSCCCSCSSSSSSCWWRIMNNHQMFKSRSTNSGLQQWGLLQPHWHRQVALKLPANIEGLGHRNWGMDHQNVPLKIYGKIWKHMMIVIDIDWHWSTLIDSWLSIFMRLSHFQTNLRNGGAFPGFPARSSHSNRSVLGNPSGPGHFRGFLKKPRKCRSQRATSSSLQFSSNSNLVPIWN